MPLSMDGQAEAYFDSMAGLGHALIATDAAGRRVFLADAMDRVVAQVLGTKGARTRIYFIGNGGSAGIASHLATDWMKNGGFTTQVFTDGALLTCLANDLGYEHVFALPLARHVRPGDMLFAISSSGESENILAGVKAAEKAGAQVVTMSGFSPDNLLRKLGDLNFYVPNSLYGFVEIAHLTLCHAILDLSMGWRADGSVPTYTFAEMIA